MAQANSNSIKNINNRKCPPRPPRRPPPGDDGIAGRTRQQKRTTIASEWKNLDIPIKIEIFSYLDQESLMNLSLVSKQSNDIICKELGNKNKIIPVFEIGLISMPALCQNLLNHSLNRETNNKLQRYQIMRFKDSYKYTKDETNLSVEAFMELQRETMRKVRFTGITSLDFDGFSLSDQITDRIYQNYLIYIFSCILPKLREVKFSCMPITGLTLSNFSMNCPLLEKVTLNNNDIFEKVIRLNGSDMRHSNSLKEIYLDCSGFECGLQHRNAIEDLNDQPEVYMFHHCCKALERVSIRNPKLCYQDDKIISQNTLIKFVRNAPLTLRWFRSDLTLNNMKMLRLERPGIELLN
ncbi:hypothetical protein FRACYDRAFT_251199 [Fragilariopsis cylindrus CCMP1102]|uniref:F-box domain-containing protein n=1 Tax=Fragilariopsis cylindrus CCMP1102 TaxID=635003 RepID=A0A1E7ENH2_9STRA|nr:hypothetical protein FRACYDRAFT_251199 [Fragilariopsis cylindrus CCMP1102]|eukprot:OEU07394.1 hypothetical protein FRACYDRAFT_251199 [Fragilariopsis cylindrus CCMP1102]